MLQTQVLTEIDRGCLNEKKSLSTSD